MIILILPTAFCKGKNIFQSKTYFIIIIFKEWGIGALNHDKPMSNAHFRNE